ncbi:hypothetical protein EPR50_G00149460 [Perca flavescens]|uniref:Uncharacterized protein n=1 Tax=Perca flavescens TaxID=8167 RepID=A0A484CJQ8_PERFV|nr:hypothetical protein EPR50_G00149460 [Perca flavescens]
MHMGARAEMEMSGLVEGWFSCIARVDRQKAEEEQRTSQSTDSSNVRLVGYTGRSPRREEDITSRPFSIDQ